jgi:uncharacterized glyoxalase superfamily protein PhnB
MPVNPIPQGYHTITPYLIIKEVSRLVHFLKVAFDAQEVRLTLGHGGVVTHAELRIGTSMIMLTEAGEDFTEMPAMLYLYVPNVDTLYENAMKAGAESLVEPQNMYYGDRCAGVRDPSGNQWWIATHIEDVSDTELAQRENKLREEEEGQQ